MSKSRKSSPLSQRRRWNADEAREILAAIAASGTTVEAYAARHGLRPGRLYLWQRRFGVADVDRVDFHEVKRRPRVPLADPAVLEVLLPSGAVIRFASEVAVDRIGAILRELR